MTPNTTYLFPTIFELWRVIFYSNMADRYIQYVVTQTLLEIILFHFIILR